jgi:hypothetical protein
MFHFLNKENALGYSYSGFDEEPAIMTPPFFGKLGRVLLRALARLFPGIVADF